MELIGKRVALLVADDYQELEVWYPILRLQEAGATVVVVGTGVKTTYASKLGYPITVDASADEVDASEFDAVLVPGGFAPDDMRVCEPMLDLVRELDAQQKLVASICHGGWVLVSAGVLRGRRATGYRPIRDDVVNAGGEWVDEEVVVDGHLITSRTPPDLPAYMREIVRFLAAQPSAASRAREAAVAR